VPRERAVEAAGDEEKRQSLRLCLSGVYRGRIESRPGRASALRSKTAVRPKHGFDAPALQDGKMLRSPALPSNLVK
jgi:hypothetical protein